MASRSEVFIQACDRGPVLLCGECRAGNFYALIIISCLCMTLACRPRTPALKLRIVSLKEKHIFIAERIFTLSF